MNDGNRTRSPQNHNLMLHQLSYVHHLKKGKSMNSFFWCKILEFNQNLLINFQSLFTELILRSSCSNCHLFILNILKNKLGCQVKIELTWTKFTVSSDNQQSTNTALQDGIEPPTSKLTAFCSTAELLENKIQGIFARNFFSALTNWATSPIFNVFFWGDDGARTHDHSCNRRWNP